MPPRRHWRLTPRIRVAAGETIAIGPGKADLLEALERTGTIRDAAAALGMSYMRAWSLVRTMNASFRTPLVAAARGGSHRGGAILTDTGREVLRLYRKMESDAQRAAERAFEKLHPFLR